MEFPDEKKSFNSTPSFNSYSPLTSPYDSSSTNLGNSSKYYGLSNQAASAFPVGTPKEGKGKEYGKDFLRRFAQSIEDKTLKERDSEKSGSSVWNTFTRPGSYEKRVKLYTPEQEAIFKRITKGMGENIPSSFDYISRILGGDEDSFSRFEAPARRNFEEKTLPSIAERFSADFGEGSQETPAFAQAAVGAGKELEEGLFSRRQDLQSQAFSDLQSLLAPSQAHLEKAFQQPRQSAWMEVLKTAAAAAVQAAVGAFTGKKG
jgi:hypothetical protein